MDDSFEKKPQGSSSLNEAYDYKMSLKLAVKLFYWMAWKWHKNVSGWKKMVFFLVKIFWLF